jgi:putative tryptophan/tyrosine transport system permease protein
MEAFFELIMPSMMQALVLSLVALGIMIPFKILHFPDLTSEGSYPFGGAICASMIVFGIDPIISTIAACIFAGIAGICTAIIHMRLKINTLLAGIIVSTMIYSVNLRLMGKPNIALFEYNHLFSDIEDLDIRIAILLGINLIIIVPILLYFYTEKGLALRAAGANPLFAQKVGIDIRKSTILGLFIGNALCGLAGSIIVQLQGYGDIAMGVGIVVHALAALMIGEAILHPDTITKQILAPFAGAIVYQQIQGFALSMGLAASDLKFFTGAIVLLVLMVRRVD